MSTTEVVLSFAVIGLVIYIYNSTAQSPSTCTTTSAGCKKKKGSKKKRSQTHLPIVGKEEEIVFIDKKQKDLLQSEQPVIRKMSKEKSKNQPVFKEEEPKSPQKIRTKNEVIEVSPKLPTSVNEYEDAGWDEVKPKYSKTLKIISNSQPSTAFVHQKKEMKVKDNRELTKKQKQNLRKAERVKELKTASSSIQQERLQEHR